jgi:hypothetical protein
MYTKKSFEHNEAIAHDPKERRTVKRRHLIYYLRVWDADSGQLLGHVVDITTEGLMLISEGPIPLDTDFRLELRWQEEDQENRTLTLRARSMWQGRDANPHFHDTGFQLLEADMQAALEPIRQLIDRFGFRD